MPPRGGNPGRVPGLPRHLTLLTPRPPVALTGPVTPGDWILGYDASGKVYLFKEGARVPGGGTAGAAGLVDYVDMGAVDLQTLSLRIVQAERQLGYQHFTGNQLAAISQSVDVGTIEQGGNFIAFPRGQQRGTTLPGQGQKPSGSSAVFAPIVPGSNIVSGVAGAITDTTSFLAWIAWIFHPVNLLRAVEFLTGMALILYGFHTLLVGMRRGSSTHRTSARSVFSDLFPKTAARRRGRRAGRVQGERDSAYRQARRERVGYDTP